jgi:adenylyltransferase/sulfurtransferase
VGAVASISAAEALKLLVGGGELNRGMIHVDLWDLSLEHFGTGGPRPDCVACGVHRYEFLDEEQGSTGVSLCGRNAVQVRIASNKAKNIDLNKIAQQLSGVATIIAQNDFLLRFAVPPEYEITLFADARAIIKGTADESVARGLYAKYIGS